MGFLSRLLAALALLWASAAPAQPAAPPQRIVTLIPSLTESVCALGACARLVGVDRYSNWPASVAALPHLGGLDDVQIERVVALKPDLVLAPPSSRAIERLRGLGLRVVVLEARTHAEVRQALEALAAVLGVPQAAAPLWAGIERDLDAARTRVPAAWLGRRAYVEVSPEPYAAGRASFLGETLARLGLDNIVPAELGPFPKLSPEFVVRAQPDLIIATAREWAAMPARPGWAALTAVRQSHACAFAPASYDLLVRPGPRLGEGALLLADCLSALRPLAAMRAADADWALTGTGHRERWAP